MLLPSSSTNLNTRLNTIDTENTTASSFSICNENDIQNSVIESQLMSYFKIKEIENNYPNICDQFYLDILHSLQSSKNCMLSCFNTTISNDDMGKNRELSGSVIVIDIGGSTLRICQIQFTPRETIECKVNQSWDIANSAKNFDRSFLKWVIGKFKNVIDVSDDSLKDSNEKLKVVICWSFPITQEVTQNDGIISDLGKGFSVCDEYKGASLKLLFETNFMDYDIPIEVYSIINDSASVFTAGSYFENSDIALVLGTGLNTSFLADSSFVGPDKRKIPGNHFIINSEASFLGYHLSKYITPLDVKINELWTRIESEDLTPPHLTTKYGVFQPLELLTAGRYIPEIVRLTTIEYQLDHLKEFETPYSLSGKDLAYYYNQIPSIRMITDIVIKRASLTLVAYLTSLLKILGLKDSPIKISVVGSMLQHFPGYRQTVETLLPADVTLCFLVDANLYGAALSAFALDV